jgi:hypothetical protein
MAYNLGMEPSDVGSEQVGEGRGGGVPLPTSQGYMPF